MFEILSQNIVLTKIAIGNAMVHIVDFDAVDTEHVYVATRVVQRRQDTTSKNKINDGINVTRDNINGEKMQIFAHKKLKWVNINSV